MNIIIHNYEQAYLLNMTTNDCFQIYSKPERSVRGRIKLGESHAKQVKPLVIVYPLIWTRLRI